MTSFAVCVKASSSASVDDIVTVVCFVAFQLIGPPNKHNLDPCDDFRVFTSSAKVASDASFRSFCCLTRKISGLKEVRPKPHVKVLGIVMDKRLKYKEHIARAASEGLEAAVQLKRLRGLSPATARQLFTAMVSPVVDYASNVWRHACIYKAAKMLDRVQRIGAQAITGAFRTVATSVAEAEAHISNPERNPRAVAHPH